MITIDKNRCIGCGKCADVCPTHAIISFGEPVLVREGLCRGCGACVEACPKGAISMMPPSLNPYPTKEITPRSTVIPFDSRLPRARGGRHRYGRRGR